MSEVKQRPKTFPFTGERLYVMGPVIEVRPGHDYGDVEVEVRASFGTDRIFMRMPIEYQEEFYAMCCRMRKRL